MSDLFKDQKPRLSEEEERRLWEHVRTIPRDVGTEPERHEPWWRGLFALPAVRYGVPALAVALVAVVWVWQREPESPLRDQASVQTRAGEKERSKVGLDEQPAVEPAPAPTPSRMPASKPEPLASELLKQEAAPGQRGHGLASGAPAAGLPASGRLAQETVTNQSERRLDTQDAARDEVSGGRSRELKVAEEGATRDKDANANKPGDERARASGTFSAPPPGEKAQKKNDAPAPAQESADGLESSAGKAMPQAAKSLSFQRLLRVAREDLVARVSDVPRQGPFLAVVSSPYEPGVTHLIAVAREPEARVTLAGPVTTLWRDDVGAARVTQRDAGSFWALRPVSDGVGVATLSLDGAPPLPARLETADGKRALATVSAVTSFASSSARVRAAVLAVELSRASQMDEATGRPRVDRIRKDANELLRQSGGAGLPDLIAACDRVLAAWPGR